MKQWAKQSKAVFSLFCGLLSCQTFPFSGLGPYRCISFLSRGSALGGGSTSHQAPVFINMTRTLTACGLRQQEDLASISLNLRRWGNQKKIPVPPAFPIVEGPAEASDSENPTRPQTHHHLIAYNLHMGLWAANTDGRDLQTTMLDFSILWLLQSLRSRERK